MPIDPSIYQIVRTPESPFKTMSEMATLRNQQLAQQIAQQRLQMEQQEVAEKQKAAHAKAMLNATIGKYIKPDLTIDKEGLFSELQGSPDLPAVLESVNGFEEASNKAAKAKRENDASQDEHERDMAANLGLGAKYLADKGQFEDAAGLITTGMAAGHKRGLIADDEATGIISQMDPSQPESVNAVINKLIAQKPPKDTTPPNTGSFEDYVRRTAGTNPTPEQILAARKAYNQADDVAKAATTPNVGSFEDYVTRTYGPNPTSAQVLAARKAYGQADDRPTAISVNVGAPDDNKAISDAIQNGYQPPILTNLPRAAVAAIRADMAKKGYDLTSATKDWQAMTRYISTLNGAQQTRLRQATEFVRETVPLVRSLSGELTQRLPRSQFPLLNRGAIAAAKNGLMGQEAQSAATKLDSQIADMQAELAVMYRGGNASTDEALKKASDMLKGNWSESQLSAALDLIEKNSQIRLNSIKNTSVATPGMEPNRYAPADTAPATVDDLRKKYNY